VEQGRAVQADRFHLPAPGLVADRHVLVLEDTWVTGASAQSAAVTLKDAGARAVTIRPLARWLWESTTEPDGAAFFASLGEPYDPLRCPPHAGQHCYGPYQTWLMP
jgi:hypothetical protein